MQNPLPCTVKCHRPLIVIKLHDADIQLMENKAVNPALACKKLNGIAVLPGQTFSFCPFPGKTDQKRGCKDGLIIEKGSVFSGMGGGLCRIANIIRYLVPDSPKP